MLASCDERDEGKTMKRYTTFALIIILALSTYAYGQPSKKFGAGLVFGEPTGISARYWLKENRSLNSYLSWNNEPASNFRLQGSYVFYHFDLLGLEPDAGQLPLYYGLGVHARLGNESEFGLRAPIGISYIFNTAPLDIFMEFAPTVTLFPDLEFGDPHTGNLEARLGFNIYFGGTTDRDGDGIPDNRDDCPDQAEDIDGFEDSDGCPEFDNDNDGVPDDVDKCPNRAEDLDGFQDDDGCPDLDNDNDGILDDKDKCPNAAETVNGFEDDDGCPDEKPQAELKIIREEPLILEGVNFEYDSARLEENSKRILDLVYRSLDNNSDVEVKIGGHTDAIASAEYNLDLSQRRAESVKNYLVQRGIDPDRIETEGYGESQPIATNETSEGRAQNRRIEIIRID